MIPLWVILAIFGFQVWTILRQRRLLQKAAFVILAQHVIIEKLSEKNDA